MVRWIDRPGMAFDFGCKATKHKIQQTTKHAKLFSTQIVKQEQHACLSFRDTVYGSISTAFGADPEHSVRGSGNFFFVINVFSRGPHRGTYGSPSSVCLSVRPSVRPSVCLSVCLFVCLSVCLSVCLPACLSDCLSVCLISHPSTSIRFDFTFIHFHLFIRFSTGVRTSISKATYNH